MTKIGKHVSVSNRMDDSRYRGSFVLDCTNLTILVSLPRHCRLAVKRRLATEGTAQIVDP